MPGQGYVRPKNSTWNLTSPCISGAGDPQFAHFAMSGPRKVDQRTKAAVSAGLELPLLRLAPRKPAAPAHTHETIASQVIGG